MSWFSNLAETYDRVSKIAGQTFADNNGDDESEVLVPRNHMAANTNICVTIDGEGQFLNAEFNKDRINICVPCTEDSASRTVAIVSHPLHEQLSYLALNGEKRAAYLKNLSAWCGRHPKAGAVYKYVCGGTLMDDLAVCKIDKQEEKLFVRFRVEIPGDLYTDIWKDPGLIKAWQDYCDENETGEKVLCYVTGVPAVPATKHPKGIHIPYNAKLISCNDETNYTYRGRFTKAEQANSIGAAASHKAHAMLKYLVATQGYKCDTQAIVAWGLEDGRKQITPIGGTSDVIKELANENDWDHLYEDSEDTEDTEKKDSAKILEEAQIKLETDYVKLFCNALGGYGSTKKLGAVPRVAVLALDAATTGRMGITFYQDLSENEYIERVKAWHRSCCWWFYFDKHDRISAPSADEIIRAVYGEPKGEGYKKIKKQARERLLHNVVGGEPLDHGWIAAAVTRVNQPFSYEKEERSGGGWDKWRWFGALNVTCAMVRKYYAKDEEEISLELDKSCTNRSYLFGRLLAVADMIETHARAIQLGRNSAEKKTAGNSEAAKEADKRGDDTDKRPTNAVRYMSRFAGKPFRTWKTIYSDQLNPYIQRLNGAEGYQRQIDEIMSLFNPGEFENDGPLDGRYLMGYSLQRRTYNKSKSEEKNGEENKNGSDQ